MIETGGFSFPRPGRSMAYRDVCQASVDFQGWVSIFLSQTIGSTSESRVLSAKLTLADTLLRFYHAKASSPHPTTPHQCLLDIFVQAYQELDSLAPVVSVEEAPSAPVSERNDLLLEDG